MSKFLPTVGVILQISIGHIVQPTFGVLILYQAGFRLFDTFTTDAGIRTRANELPSIINR